MKHKLLLLLRVLSLLLLFCFCFAQCKKQHDTPKTEIEKLPAITQEGKNTFGCLLNDTAYVSGGGGLLDNTLKCLYDPTFGGGDLSIKAKKYINGNDFISITLNARPVNTSGNFLLTDGGVFGVAYFDTQSSCKNAT